MERTIKVRTFLGQAIDTFKEYIKTKGNLQIDYSLEEYMQEILDYIDYLEKEIQGLKKQLEDYKKLGFKYLQDKNNNLEKQQKEFIKFLEDEKDRLARECSNIYEDSLGHTRLVNEDKFNEVNDILQKYKSIIGDDK